MHFARRRASRRLRATPFRGRVRHGSAITADILEDERRKLEQANLALQREIAERERAELALLQSTQRFTGIVQHAHEVIYTLSQSGCFSFVSPAATRLLGYEEQELLGRSYSEFIHPEDRPACREFFESVLAGRISEQRLRFRVQHTSGAWRWLATTGALLPDIESAAAFMGVAQDVTEQKRAEDLLAESEQMYRLLAEHSADVIFTTDGQNNFTYISPAVERLTGYPQSEAMRMSFLDIMHHSSRRVIETAQRQRLEAEAKGRGEDSSKTWELLLQRKDGSLLWTETVTTPLRDDAGAFEGVLGVTRDISDRKQAEQALEQAHRDMSALISAITAILVLVDDRDRITHWNQSARDAFGHTPASAQGSLLHKLDLGWDWELLGQGLQACRDNNAPERLDDLHYTRRDQSEGLLGLTLYPVAGGGVLLLGRDITEARTRELRQAHEQKMQSIGRLASGVAHELNTPIQYLGFNAGFLEDAFAGLSDMVRGCQELQQRLQTAAADPESWAALQEELPRRLARLESVAERVDLAYLLEETPLALDNSRKGVEQISSIVQAMKQLSHPGRMAERSRGMVDCNAIVQNAVTVTRNEWKRHSQVTLELEEGLPLVPGWGGELGQVVVNLLLNAAQANEEALPPDGLGNILVSTRCLGEHVEIAVADDGPGIPEDRRDKIFDPFYTTKDVGKGSGQGLAIAHAIVVEQHGGALEVGPATAGAQREGALFRLLLPLRQTEQEA